MFVLLLVHEGIIQDCETLTKADREQATSINLRGQVVWYSLQQLTRVAEKRPLANAPFWRGTFIWTYIDMTDHGIKCVFSHKNKMGESVSQHNTTAHRLGPSATIG